MIDNNGDGMLSFDEWSDGLKTSGIKLSDEDVLEMWRLIDMDGSGVVDSEEMALFLRGGYKTEVLDNNKQVPWCLCVRLED